MEYDAIGNPETYRDGITMTWQNGRQLASFTQTNGASVNYTYDVDGLRTGKIVTKDGATTEYNYIYENGLLLQMTRGSRILDFSYDANGTPVSIAYRSRATANPTYYYYGTNWRGDVVALLKLKLNNKSKADSIIILWLIGLLFAFYDSCGDIDENF